MPTLLITGASGYLGTELVARALAGAWEVVGTYLSHPPAERDGLRCAALDVRDAGAVDRLLDAHRPDAIVHTAYRQSGPDAEAITHDGARLVAVGAQRIGARLVHLSSDCVFSGAAGRPLTEEDPVSPVNAYGRAKAAAEASVAAAHPAALLVRTSLIYGGPEARPSRYEEQAVAAARGEQRLTFFTDERRSPIQVGDLAAALLELVVLPQEHGVLHVAGPDALDRLAFARLLAHAAGVDPFRLHGAPAPPDPPRPRDCALDSSRAVRRLRTPLRGVRAVLGVR